MAGMAYKWSPFDPNSWYGGTYAPGAFDTAPAAKNYYNQNPDAFWAKNTLPFASGLDAFSKFVQGRQNVWQQGWAAAQGTNPNLTVQQYGSIPTEKQFRQEFNRLPFQQRGVSYSNMGGGRNRWIGG
jgi:hypothetical protein